ncbi:MAG TPA: RnfABCDGE type electron transport complex subunit G [Desulfobacterales bacterium]
MREMIQMVVVLTILACVSGGLLAYIKDNTQEKIEYQQLVFVKGPAIRSIMEGSSNDPINDRFKIQDGDIERSFFVGVFDGQPQAVAFEATGKGFGGDIGVMVGVNVEQAQLVGIGVTTHSETPGIGALAKTDPSFAAQFRGMPIKDQFKVKTEGGQVDALSGATITSRGVAGAVTQAARIFQELKPQIQEKLNTFSK